MSEAGDQSFHNKSFQKKGANKKIEKGKKVLPNTKKFPELKLMISGEGRNSNNTFSSDEDNVRLAYFLITCRCNFHLLRRSKEATTPQTLQTLISKTLRRTPILNQVL